MQVVVTGGAGFIGGHLCSRLLNEGHWVTAVDDFITGSRENIRSLINNSHFAFIELDITKNIEKLREISRIEAIFHLASPASPNKKSKRSYINYPIETLLVNSWGTYQLLQLAKEKQARFLFASSSEIYGDPIIAVQSEDYFGNVNPNGVRSVYDEGKRFGEAITMAYVRKFSLDCRIVRIFNTFGPGMQRDDGRVVSNFVNQALVNKPLTVYGEGKQTRSFCFVTDMVSGLLKAMMTENTKAEVINLGNPDERTILELATIIREMTRSSSEIIFEELPQDDPKSRHPDIGKAKKLLDWQPAVPLADGLEKTIAYFKNT